MNSVELIKKICKDRKIPISRLERDLGYGNGYIGQLRKGTLPSDRAIEIASYLEIEVSFLLSGGTDTNIPGFSTKDERDIAKRIESALADLYSSQDGLMFSGQPLDEETRELLKISLENSIKIAKINAKAKYTPNKYKNKG